MTIDIKGVSAFYYFAIPAVLALAAIWWLSFGEGLHYFKRKLSQEKRHAEVVGAAVLPKTPMKIVLLNERDNPIVVERAEIDGNDLFVYFRNTSQGRARFIQYKLKLIAPDGTVVSSESHYASTDELDAGQRAEQHVELESDPRAVSVTIWMGRD